MKTALIEGQWMYRVDEGGRFPLPPKIRSEFGKKWILALDPADYTITIFSLETWQKMVSEADDRVQLRMDWCPFENDIDAQGRLTIPRRLRDLSQISQTIIIVSVGDRLILKNVQSYARRN